MVISHMYVHTALRRMDLRMSDMLELTLVAIKARPCRRVVATCGLLMAPVHVRLLKSLSVDCLFHPKVT